MDASPGAALAGALEFSNALLGAADRGDLEAVAELDARRLQLLKSYRAGALPVTSGDERMLREIFQLNERAIGLMEHHRRIKARALDLAAVGRRAVAAYATNRMSR